VRLALGPQHLARSEPSLKGRTLAHQRLAITHVVVNHAPALPGLLANVAQLDRKAGQLRVGGGRAGPARRDLQLKDRRGPGVVNRPCCPDTTAGDQHRQRDGKAAPPKGFHLFASIGNSGSDSWQVL
jgi:hypothetical protein